MAPRSRVMLALVGALLFSGCAVDDRDMVTDADASFAKKDCPYPGHKNCPPEPPPPPPGPVEPDFPGTTFDAMKAPLRMALTPAGRLLLSDAEARAVFTVDPATRLPDGELSIEGIPLAVGHLDDAVFVGNAETHTIEVYEADGGAPRGDFGANAVDYPVDMAVDVGSGLIYVVDGTAGNVKVFNAAGSLQSTIATRGTGTGQLTTPVGIALNPDSQEVYVGDYGPDGGNASVKIFAYDGTYVGAISGEGDCNFMGCRNGFSRPQGLAVDALGRIVMADGVLAEVHIYDRATLNRAVTLGGRLTGIPALRLPAGVAVNAAGDVFVASNRTHSVEVFEGGAQ